MIDAQETIGMTWYMDPNQQTIDRCLDERLEQLHFAQREIFVAVLRQPDDESQREYDDAVRAHAHILADIATLQPNSSTPY